MNGHMETQLGKVTIDPEVIATYAGSVAVECFGIVGMAAVTINDNAISIDFHVIVSYGVSIITVSDNLIETVKYKVEAFTGMEIKKMNIYVEGVRVID